MQRINKFTLITLLLLCGAALLGAKGCCTMTPTAFVLGSEPDFIWAYRSETVVTDEPPVDSSTLLNIPVAGVGYVDEYSFKVGPIAVTNCSEASGYSEWIARTQNLQADLSALSDGLLRLCIVGRGTDACGVLKTQPYIKANAYKWSLQRAPGEFTILAPIGNVSSLTPTATWTSSANAEEYRIVVSSDSSCMTALSERSGVTGTEVTIAVPTEGTYYLCAEARNLGGTVTHAANNGVAFTVDLSQPQEVILKDYVSDPTCWNSANSALYHYNDPGTTDGIAAAGITGGGGVLKRVGGIFSDSDCNGFNAGKIEHMTLSLAFYESEAVFLADPYLKNQPPGSVSQRYTAAKLHTDPSDPKYYLNPIRVTPAGTEQFYIEADVSAFNIRTTPGASHLVALWLSSDVTEDGQAWISLSGGCAGAVGTESDFYRSDYNNPIIPAGTVLDAGAPLPHAAYFVSEER